MEKPSSPRPYFNAKISRTLARAVMSLGLLAGCSSHLWNARNSTVCSTGVSLASTRIAKFCPMSSTQLHLADCPKPERDRFVEAFGSHFSRVLDSFSIADGDAARADGHRRRVAYSP